MSTLTMNIPYTGISKKITVPTSWKELKAMAPAKTRRAFSMIEFVMVCAAIVAVQQLVAFGYSEFQQTRKMAQMHTEMEALATACVAYETISITGMPPDTLATLASPLEAGNAIDGVSHTFVTKVNLTDGSFKDPWNTEYGYDADARTITCTPKDKSGTAVDEAITRSF